MASQAVTFTVLKRLKERYGPDMYTEQNVVLSGTHTHSGPAGYLQYLVYDITGMGFISQTFNALVDGIELSIVRAHEALRPGSLSFGASVLLDTNINRSPTAYAENPAAERALYEFDIDKEMTVLAVEDDSSSSSSEKVPRGVFTWFPCHGTSMNNTNQLVNGDNKGAAAQFLEKWAAKEQEQQQQQRRWWWPKNQKNNFIAAFCQANVGDTSPNTLGPICMDTGEPCDAVHSTCGGKVEQCIGRGPAWPDHFKSTQIIATKQAEKAKELLLDATTRTRVSGPIESRHVYLDFRKLEILPSNFTRGPARTCPPAMGFAFAAGTTDGPGAFDFTQSDVNGTAFWRLVRDFIHTPTAEQIACHAPKPILLDVGNMHYPYEWVPYIVEISILRVGNFVILAVPGEFTTMAGRRLKIAVQDAIGTAWGTNLHFVIAGLSNTYSSYITTFEEYSVQRYEGGFTLFGPHTLDAYIQEFRRLAVAMVEQKETPPGPQPPDLLRDQWSLVPGVVADGVPFGSQFGAVVKDVEKKVYQGGDVAEVIFQSACPRNDIRAEGTFLTVEKQQQNSGVDNAWVWESVWHRLAFFLKSSSLNKSTSLQQQQQQQVAVEWTVVATDNDWETKFSWFRHFTYSTESFAAIQWNIPIDVSPGVYRIHHFGNSKHFLGHVLPFDGVSGTFEVVEQQNNNIVEGGWWMWVAKALGRKAGTFFLN